MNSFVSLHNGGVVVLDKVPRLTLYEFREFIVKGVDNGARIVCFSACPWPEEKMSLICILASTESGVLLAGACEVGAEYQSITPDCPQIHMFEREIAEQWGIEPKGHPWLKPVRFQSSLRETAGVLASGDKPAGCGVMDYFQIKGEETHEVAVGPVHAGIIEPGHFRFQCHGETVYHLEISLGYQHRGIERALCGSNPAGNSAMSVKIPHYMETLAGDTTIGHTMAYCRAMESLAKCRVPARAQVIRGIAAELERMANHIGDLGALAGDIGFLPTMSYCGRIRGDVLNLTAELCGNRFGRGLVRPGGVCFDVDDVILSKIRLNLESVMQDAGSAIGLLWETPSVLSRFENTGSISLETCRAIGLVGAAARACGLNMDVRHDFPYGIYRFSQIPVSTWNTGDVFARAFVRWQEIQKSAAFILEQLDSMPDGPVAAGFGRLAPNMMAVALVEGWRGEICHMAVTGEDGDFKQYKIVDPSFHNWFGLACAMRNQQISDFPLCNKSFNLSYCGFDL